MQLPITAWEPGSSVSTVSKYGLDDLAIEVRSSTEARDFSSNLCVQTRSGAHPASCTMGTGGPFPGAKGRPGCDADHSPPSSAEVGRASVNRTPGWKRPFVRPSGGQGILVKWILHCGLDRNRWLAVVNTEMKPLVAYSTGYFSTT
jgi:hypothetical protein